MPAEHDLDPPAMTEEERRAKRRYQAAFVFEMLPSQRVLQRDQFEERHEWESAK